MSDAAKLNLSDETVPLVRLSAFKLVRLDPLPLKEVAVTAPSSTENTVVATSPLPEPADELTFLISNLASLSSWKSSANLIRLVPPICRRYAQSLPAPAVPKRMYVFVLCVLSTDVSPVVLPASNFNTSLQVTTPENVPVVVLIGLPSVPEVILLALKSGMSDAAKLNLADGTVPLLKLSAFKLVRLDPSPETEVVVRAPTFEVPWTSKVYAGEVVAMPTLPSALTTIFELFKSTLVVLLLVFSRQK